MVWLDWLHRLIDDSKVKRGYVIGSHNTACIEAKLHPPISRVNGQCIAEALLFTARHHREGERDGERDGDRERERVKSSARLTTRM